MMPTGNGHSFQVFDRKEGRINYFLEHPYRFVAPTDDTRTAGVGRRDLAHDIYFGLRVGSDSKWLTSPSSISYLDESHIIHTSESHKGVSADSYFFSPYGYEGNAMLMLVKLTNTTSADAEVSVFSKANLKFGMGRVEPGSEGENILWQESPFAHGVETGPGGGHAVYVPMGEVSGVQCGQDSYLYNEVLDGRDMEAPTSCGVDDAVAVLQHKSTLKAKESTWWGMAVLFLNNNPAHEKASAFKDPRTLPDILSLWEAYVGDRDAEGVLNGALEEMEAWRSGNAPDELNADELRLWRQSETVLRMGQVRERAKKNDGMPLAALPVGEWHTSWVRDGVYFVTSMAATEHHDEARLALEFFLGTDSNTDGFFRNEIGMPYRISACRYFGNGQEEGDYNHDGPNVETDGWGLVLWGARTYLHYSCNRDWLETLSWRGDTIYEALLNIAENIRDTRIGGLPLPDASIWEVHWNRRQQFAYTAASQIRGLYDFADIARWKGEEATADEYEAIADEMLEKSRDFLVYDPTKSIASHAGLASSVYHADGSTVEFLAWGLIPTDDPIYNGTLQGYGRLLTNNGGYRRLDPNVSLTGEGSASEYDLAEWILLDLRIGQAWRDFGDSSKGDYQLDVVTDQALANDLLIPELFNPDDGRYAGEIPMVGYGAGAWMMTQLHKYGDPGPIYDQGFDHCGEVRPVDADVVESDPDSDISGSTDESSEVEEEEDRDSRSDDEDTVVDRFEGDSSASLCSFGASEMPGRAAAGLALMCLLALRVVRKRYGRVESV